MFSRYFIDQYAADSSLNNRLIITKRYAGTGMIEYSLSSQKSLVRDESHSIELNLSSSAIAIFGTIRILKKNSLLGRQVTLNNLFNLSSRLQLKLLPEDRQQ